LDLNKDRWLGKFLWTRKYEMARLPVYRPPKEALEAVIRPGFALSGSHGMNQTARKLQHLVQAGLSNNKVEPNNGNMG